MRGKSIILFLIMAFSFFAFVSCSDNVEFAHCELTLVLDDGFEAEKSEEFDLLLSNGDAVVSLTRISFDAGVESGIDETYTAKGFAAFFMNKSGKSEELLMRGDVPYYTYTEKVNGSDIFYTVTFYRSFNAYFMVAYATPLENKNEWSERFLGYAEDAYFNDAPVINANG